MKIFVVFGSKSDETVANPLVQSLLKEGFDAEYEVISAHRDLEKLQHKLAGWTGDAVIAGAGLAAALPGVVAAMVRQPVFGIPVNSQFGGLDSLGSIAQMPPGVPVITCGPDKFSEIVSFLKHYKKQKSAGITKVHFVTSRADATPEIEKAKKIGDEKGLAITSSAQKSADAFNVYLVTEEKDIHTDEYCLHLPFFTKEEVNKPETYLTVLKWANKGGLWVGANNTRNAVQSALRLASSLPAMLYEGSVKNVRGVKGQSPYVFEFSDRYSIFDWGQMPDQLSNKGESLAFMGNFFFEFLGKADNWKNWKAPAAFEKSPALETLRKQGAFHHGLGLLGNNPRCLAVKPVNVITPTSSSEGGKLHWDYTAYKAKPENALVPLEVIFRFGVPEGSSLLKRTSDANYCKAIGLTAAPKSRDRFDVPVVEYSTKLETSDRYISYADAQTIAGLSNEEFEEITALSKLLALRLKDCFAGIGLELWDGKFEFGFTNKDASGKRGFMLVDSIGPDELRLTRDDVHLSKEALRGYYRHSPWYAGLEKAKDLADQRGSKEWKEICINELKLTPPPLSQSVKEQVEMVYKGIVKALSEKYCATTTYPDAWSLDDVVKGLKDKKKEVA